MIENFWFQVLIVALLFDIILGEPPAFIHPVVWMGKLIGLFVHRAPSGHRKLFGFFMVISCVGLAVIAGTAIISLGGFSGLIVAAFFLKSTFSIHLLLVSALGVKKDLEKDRIEKVRKDLKIFVGRDTSGLNKYQSASAVIESVAESFVDGILSPLFYFLIFGLPGALAYRMINTLDSMVGYKKEPFIDLGYVAARLDDLMNWVPARISLLFIFIASFIFGSPRNALETCIRDHGETASPNSGWPMAAVSGALKVRLEKIGYHVLGNNYPHPEVYQIKNAVNIVGISSLLVITGIYFIGRVPLIRF
ncbi:MAG TPA: cobalamin biosynthesis protein [Candidatus Methanoperedens sp.]